MQEDYLEYSELLQKIALCHWAKEHTHAISVACFTDKPLCIFYWPISLYLIVPLSIQVYKWGGGGGGGTGKLLGQPDKMFENYLLWISIAHPVGYAPRAMNCEPVGLKIPPGGGGGYLDQSLLGMCRWSLRTPTPL